MHTDDGKPTTAESLLDEEVKNYAVEGTEISQAELRLTIQLLHVLARGPERFHC